MANHTSKGVKASYICTVLVTYCLFITWQKVAAINKVLDLKGTYPYLINKTDGTVIEPRDYLDFDNMFTPNETYRRTQTAQGRNYYFLKAFDFANYYQTDYWHYSNEQDLAASVGPVANEDKCNQHLNWLDGQLNSSSDILLQRGEEHVNLMMLMDSYGRLDAGTFMGRGHWLGSYYECMRIRVNIRKFELEKCDNLSVNGTLVECTMPESDVSEASDSSKSESSTSEHQLLKTRYCMGKVRDVDWPGADRDNYVPRISYKVGLCLPESCGTLSFRKHKAIIERLMLYSIPTYLKRRLYLDDIYCLPDDQSRIRELSRGARIFLSLCISWLLLLMAATWLYSLAESHQKKRRKQMDGQVKLTRKHQQVELKLSKSLIVNNVNSRELLGERNHATKTTTTTTAAAEPPSDPLYPSYPAVGLEVDAERPLVKSAVSNGAQLLVIRPHDDSAANRLLLLEVDGTTTRHKDPHKPAPSNELDYDSDNSRASSSSSPSSAGQSSGSIISGGWLNESRPLIRILKALSIKRNMTEFQRPPLLLRQPEAGKKLRINLNALDFIKCLCCVLVIFGHIAFIYMQHLTNVLQTIEMSHQLLPRVLMSFFNFVDTFFIISGMLTAYFVFKRFNKSTFASPLVWLSIVLFRLVRLSPVYVLIFWFTKTLVVYMGEGPLWDYGTDRNSIRGLCINDHWWKSLLYIGNLGTMQPLCILPAWSIIVDAQQSIFVPPILFLIFKHKRLGYMSLLIATVISTTNMSLQLAGQTVVKTSDMAKMRLHVYPLISRFAAEFYNTAWNRIGPVAIGILSGHMLYLYDMGRIRRWPWFMRGAYFKLVLAMHLFIFALPSLGLLTDPPESTQETNIIIFILSNATVKPVWALINAVFLLRLVTDLRRSSVVAQLMSHNIWHYLGKLCFVSYLIHYEVIMFLLKSRKDALPDPNWFNYAREFSVAFMISSIVAYFVYILFEAPINNLLMLHFVKPNYRQRRTMDASAGGQPVGKYHVGE